ncbi:MAG: hypothetical protein JJ971_10870 [Balneolaceae bacterium]|nr:hypothetical protein [Balneolaceae bacterium]MBO6546251.1 hypothetical protein [Balneolaceae bacterium]MBO6648610.1 hypothetical protein [Balneolaceae bacterium]
MKVKYTLPLFLSLSIICVLPAQETSQEKEDMKLIYSSRWSDWDWHCNCRVEEKIESKSYHKERGYYKYRSNYKNDGIDNEFDFFSHIGPNPAIYSFSPSVQAIHFNRVNGLFLGIDTEFEDLIHDFTHIYGFEVQALGGYSFGQDEWQYQLGIEKPIGRKLRVGGDIHSITNTEDVWRSGLSENSISSVVAGYDFHDYFKAEGFSLYGSLRLLRNTYLGASYNSDLFSSLDAVTEYNIYGEGNIYRVNPSIDSDFDEINHQSIGFSVNLNPKMYNQTRNFATSLTLRGEIGNLPESSNQFLFNKYIIQSKSVMRIDRTTSLKWRVMGGAITGNAPDFKQFALGGIGTMRATNYKSLQGNAMVLSNAELIFGRNSDFDLGFINFDGFYFSVFMDSGWSEFNNELLNNTDPVLALQSFSVNKLNHNAGVGFGSDSFRIEFAKPISNSGGFSAFWIRLNPTF